MNNITIAKMLAHMEDHVKSIPDTATRYLLTLQLMKDSYKGFPTDHPVDYVCLECGKWASEL